MYDVIRLGVEGVGQGLLMHNPAGMAVAAAEAEGKPPARGGKKIPKQAIEAAGGLYILKGSDQLYAADDWFREASLISSKEFRDKTRRGNATYMQRFGASVFLANEGSPLVRAGTGQPVTSDPADWELYLKRAVVQGQGIVRARPLIRNLPPAEGGPWACTVEFEYDTDTITPAEIAMIVNQAGKFPGVGDYRPGKKGPFGRYQLVSVDGEAYTP